MAQYAAMEHPDLAATREEYQRQGLDRAEMAADPFTQFRGWLDDAVGAGLREPNAMTLATTDRDLRPSARTVLLRGVDERGFVFFTNYASRKARELGMNPNAALVFLWTALERQVCVAGTVAKVTPEESDAYFSGRPRGSRLGAWASPQSTVLADRGQLEAYLGDVGRRFAGRDIPRPPHWGGYRLDPATVEFWQGRPDRLHDRLRYRRERDGWALERLAP